MKETEIAMRKVSAFVALAALAAAVTSVNVPRTLATSDVLHGNPFHRTRGDAANHTARTTGNLVYHAGGAVQTATPRTTYAIYWGSTFAYNGIPGTGATNSYQTLINGYFGNVAADSGKTSNVYYSDTQYYQTIGGLTTYIPYSESFNATTYSDPALPTTNGCASTAGGTVACVSDAQVQVEVAKAIAANHWPTGMDAEYFVFLANGVSTCSGSSCFVSQFCAYHAHYMDSSTGQNVLYANMPFSGYQLGSCSGASGTPNGNAAADATISTTSHEANETITDALGNAWFDRSGNENGDKCAYNYGTRLGVITGGDYNQTIGSGHYEMQQEWSNKSSGCVLTGQ